MEEGPMEEDPMAPRTPQAPHAQCAVDSSNLGTTLAL